MLYCFDNLFGFVCFSWSLLALYICCGFWVSLGFVFMVAFRFSLLTFLLVGLGGPGCFVVFAL